MKKKLKRILRIRERKKLKASRHKERINSYQINMQMESQEFISMKSCPIVGPIMVKQRSLLEVGHLVLKELLNHFADLVPRDIQSQLPMFHAHQNIARSMSWKVELL